MLAGKRLFDEGHTPTVAEAADAALVSRATAYRYFGSQEELLVACVVATGWPTPEELFARPDMPSDPEDRVAYIHDFLFDFIHERETVFRHYLRRQLLLGLEAGNDYQSQRPGFRVGLLHTALAPLADELGPERLQRLINTLGVLIGTEALIASHDSLHLDHHTARTDNRWACRQLIRAARTEAATDHQERPTRRRRAKPPAQL